MYFRQIHKMVSPIFLDVFSVFHPTAYSLNSYSLGVPMGRQGNDTVLPGTRTEPPCGWSWKQYARTGVELYHRHPANQPRTAARASRSRRSGTHWRRSGSMTYTGEAIIVYTRQGRSFTKRHVLPRARCLDFRRRSRSYGGQVARHDTRKPVIPSIARNLAFGGTIGCVSVLVYRLF